MDEPDTPLDSPLRMGDVMESPRYLDLWRAKLAPGDPAFDFELPLLGAGDTVRLSTFAGDRPVALIFGSYT
jgi:hypothetical protein